LGPQIEGTASSSTGSWIDSYKVLLKNLMLPI